MDRNAHYYLQSARDYGLPVKIHEAVDGFEVRLGGEHYYFRGSHTPYNSFASAQLAGNKFTCNYLLAHAGFPVPKYAAISEQAFLDGHLEEYIAHLKFPLVAKPTKDTSKGQDVLCNIQTLAELEDYLREYLKIYPFISIEEFYGDLKSYRVLLFKGKVLDVVLRKPAEVFGNGKHAIKQLIVFENKRRRAISEILAPIQVDKECAISLNEQNLTLDSIPDEGARVYLGYTTNASRGGNFISLGKCICKENLRLLQKAAKVLNLDLVGFDVLCEDSRIPIASSGGVIIEANYTPSIRIHEECRHKPVRVSKSLIRSLIYRHPLSYLYGLFKT